LPLFLTAPDRHSCFLHTRLDGRLHRLLLEETLVGSFIRTMVSRKKAKGKARKAAKGKEKQSTSADEPQVELDTQMQRLRLEDLLLNNAARPNSIEEKVQREQQMLRRLNNAGRCLHGLVPKPDGDICNQFVVEFAKEYNQAISSGSKLLHALDTARNATQFAYVEVYNDKSKLE